MKAGGLEDAGQVLSCSPVPPPDNFKHCGFCIIESTRKLLASEARAEAKVPLIFLSSSFLLEQVMASFTYTSYQ